MKIDKEGLIKYILEDFDIEKDFEDMVETYSTYVGLSSGNITNNDIIAFCNSLIDEVTKLNKKIYALTFLVRELNKKIPKEEK